MNRRIGKVLVAGTLMAAIVSGCQNVAQENETTAVIEEVTNGVELSDNAKVILEYETKINGNEAVESDFLELGNLYQSEGLIRKQRDLLEQYYKLYGNEDVLSGICSITVNAAEENVRVQEELERMYQNLDVMEYWNEAAGMLISEDWYSIMMPELKEGFRNYYLEKESGALLYVQTGYDEEGMTFAKVWQVNSENQVRFLRKSGDSVQMVVTNLVDGQYTGEFQSWFVEAATGNVYHEAGTLENGKITGDYSVRVRFGQGEDDLFALWQGRENMDFTAYNGNFDSEGCTTLEQGKIEAGKIIYAYDESKKNYLYVYSEEVATDKVFDATMLGMDVFPEFTRYEIVESNVESMPAGQVNAEDILVRIYDGKVQWFDGTNWYTAGSVNELEKEDPFYVYEDKASQEENGEKNTLKSDLVYGQRGAGKVETPAATTKPSTNTQNNTTTVTPKPPVNNNSSTGTKPPASNNNNNDSSDNNAGGGNSNTETNRPESSPEDTGAGEDTGNNGGGNEGDVDIEWTDDIL